MLRNLLLNDGAKVGLFFDSLWTFAKIREDYRETAEKNVKTDLMLEEVAKAEDIKVEAKDLDAEVAAMAAAYGATPQQVQKIIKEQGRIGDLAASVLRKKTAQFIIDNIAE